MVGFDPGSTVKLSKSEYAAAGAVSGIVTRACLQPLDVIKIRFQLQVEPLSRNSRNNKYWGLSQATKLIIQEETYKALWKGHVPAQLLSVIYGVVQFLSFEMLTKQAWQLIPHSNHTGTGPTVHFFCGALAGSLATVAGYPFDTIRTRLIAQGEPRHYRNVSHAMVTIFTCEGPRAFFKGLSPTLIQIAPHTGAQFAFYSVITRLWKDWVQHKVGSRHPSVIGSLVCGSLSGICAKTIIYPLDLAKKRMQVQGFENGRRGFGETLHCRGLFHCLWLTIEKEGITSLYKGLYPSLIKAAAATALHFTIYEQSCRAIESLHR